MFSDSSLFLQSSCVIYYECFECFFRSLGLIPCTRLTMLETGVELKSPHTMKCGSLSPSFFLNFYKFSRRYIACPYLT